MSYLQNAQTMYDMVGQGQMLEAFEKFYHDDVVMVEGSGEIRTGKEVSRAFEKQWMEGIQEFHGGGARSISSNEDEKTTMVEAWSDVTLKNGQRLLMEEVAVQKWDGDQIVHERFYYNPGPMGTQN